MQQSTVFQPHNHGPNEGTHRQAKATTRLRRSTETRPRYSKSWFKPPRQFSPTKPSRHPNYPLVTTCWTTLDRDECVPYETSQALHVLTQTSGETRSPQRPLSLTRWCWTNSSSPIAPYLLRTVRQPRLIHGWTRKREAVTGTPVRPRTPSNVTFACAAEPRHNPTIILTHSGISVWTTQAYAASRFHEAPHSAVAQCSHTGNGDARDACLHMYKYPIVLGCCTVFDA